MLWGHVPLCCRSLGPRYLYDIEQNYHVGDQIIVFVNQNDPLQSVVQRREIRLEYVWKNILIAVIFCGMIWRVVAANKSVPT